LAEYVAARLALRRNGIGARVTYRFITLTNAVPGDEAAFADWYVTHHLNDVVRIPGVLGGQFFAAVEPENARWRHMAVFEVNAAAIPGIFEQMAARAGTAAMPLHAMERESYFFLIAEPAGGWTGADAGGSNCRLLALGRALEGREQEVVDWYEQQHFPDMLRIPGFLGVQRFDVAISGRGNEPPWRFGCLYAAQAEDPATLVQAVAARRGTDQMKVTDALDLSVGVTCLFAAVTPRRTAATA
jgi:hypothetical protein